MIQLGRLAKPLNFRPLVTHETIGGQSSRFSSKVGIAAFHTCMKKDLFKETGNLTGFRNSIYEVSIWRGIQVMWLDYILVGRPLAQRLEGLKIQHALASGATSSPRGK